MSRPRYFRATNLYMPNRFWWVDRAIIVGIFALASVLMVASAWQMVKP